MSLRHLNMNDVAHLRRHSGALHGMQLVGKGSFASVFASAPDSRTVMKVTNDRIGYWYATDPVWLDERENVGQFFPSVIEDHDYVGRSRGLDVYLIEIERLFPVSSAEHRRQIRKWTKEYDLFSKPYRKMKILNYTSVSIDFCTMKAAQMDEPYRQVFEALKYFFKTYEGALDFKMSNFLQRADGSLVWNDLVFDVETFEFTSRSLRQKSLCRGY